jgi:AraC-like DNA-binding protein
LPWAGQAVTVTRVEGPGLTLTLVEPPPDLAPYITLYYRTEVGPEGVTDLLPPEGANLRAGTAARYEAAIGGEPLRPVPAAVLSGPTSEVTRLVLRDGRFWGIGLLPLGVAQFLGVNVAQIADRFSDIADHPATGPLHDLLRHLVHTRDTVDSDVARMNAHFRALLDPPHPHGNTIEATHRALLCDGEPSVARVAAMVGVSTRTLERLCARYFGFTPQLLLRRQRFLRSLAHFMIDPSTPWIRSLDVHYHDQAHFLRDFKRFLGMRPSEYAAMDHPIAMTAAHARRRALGPPMQVLHAVATSAVSA